MPVFSAPSFSNHENVIFCHDKATGLKAIIAIHDTTLGSALGGCRFWNYASENEALNDVLRLSQGMTYKAAISKLPLGGGKSVIIGDPKAIKTKELLLAFGRFVDRLGGLYITAEDVGTSVEDMSIIHTQTDHVVGLAGGSGDPSPLTAYGVYRGLCAAAKHKFGADTPQGMRVVVQGLGHVGMNLCKHLHQAGAQLFVFDINEQAVKTAVDSFGATVLKAEDIFTFEADIFSPCALGAILNDTTIPQMKYKIIAGAANNQLESPHNGEQLRNLGILYTPDYVLNAGGLINVWYERSHGGYDRATAMEHIETIHETLLEIFSIADQEGIPTNRAAGNIAERRIAETASAK